MVRSMDHLEKTMTVVQLDDGAVERQTPYQGVAVRVNKRLGVLPWAILAGQLLVQEVEVRRTSDPSSHFLQCAFWAGTTETVGIAEDPLEDVLLDGVPLQELLEAASSGERQRKGQQSPLLLELLLGHQPQDV